MATVAVGAGGLAAGAAAQNWFSRTFLGAGKAPEPVPAAAPPPPLAFDRRLTAAVQVMAGNHTVMRGECVFWDAMKAQAAE